VHPGEIRISADVDRLAAREDSKIGRRPADYLELKRLIEERLVAQFSRYFPALAPLIVCRGVSTPLSTVAFTGAQHGGVYGLEASPRRFLSSSLRAKTPVPGMYLAGQDVASAGITGAMMGGVLAAAAFEPRVLSHVS
jgi:all-trans-retinol 13,14-reductase